MESYFVEHCAVDPLITRIYFENFYIGEVEYDEENEGYKVFPSWADYSGFFKQKESAIMELIFHYYAQTRAVPMC